MGTSSIFYGRSDKNPLLPDDYEAEPNPVNDINHSVTWKTVKTDMSKYLTSGGTHGSVRHIVRQYIRASGGVHHLIAQSKVGIHSGTQLGNFFNSIRTNGVEQTFYNLGVELEGKSVYEIFSRVADALSPSANSKEDIIARKAIQYSLVIIFDYIERNDFDISCLSSLPIELIKEAMCDYIGSYIWIKIMNDLGCRLEKYLSDLDTAYQIENEFKEMIMGIVKVEYEKEGDLFRNQNIEFSLRQLYERCLHIMEEIV